MLLKHGLIDSRTYLIQHSEGRTRESHQLKFRVPYANKDLFKFSYLPRTISDWNCLPEAVASSSSLDCLKSNLSAFLTVRRALPWPPNKVFYKLSANQSV